MKETEQLKKLMEAIGENRPTHFQIDKTIADDMYRYESGMWWPLAGDLFSEEMATPENFEAWLDEMGRDDVNVKYETFKNPEGVYKVESIDEAKGDSVLANSAISLADQLIYWAEDQSDRDEAMAEMLEELMTYIRANGFQV